MNTPTPAHVALVAALEAAARSFESSSSIAQTIAAFDRVFVARNALLDALAQPALAAPVLPHCWMVSGSSRAHFGEYAEHDATEEARRCGGGARAYPLHMPQQPTPAATPEPCKSDSGECHYDGGCLFHGACMHNYDAAPVTEIPVSDQVMQPVEASPPKDAAEVQRFIGSNFGSATYANGYGGPPDDDDRYELTAHALLTCFREWLRYEIPVEIAAPVAPTPENPIAMALALFPVDLPGQSFVVNGDRLTADGDDRFYSAKKVEAFIDAMHEQITKAALSAAKPELSDAQITDVLYAINEIAEVYDRTEYGLPMRKNGHRAAMVESVRAALKLQAGGEEA